MSGTDRGGGDEAVSSVMDNLDGIFSGVGGGGMRCFFGLFCFLTHVLPLRLCPSVWHCLDAQASATNQCRAFNQLVLCCSTLEVEDLHTFFFFFFFLSTPPIRFVQQPVSVGCLSLAP